MLIRAFQIKRRRPLQVVAFLQHESMGRAGIEPDIQDVANLLVILNGVIVAQEARGIGIEPDVGTTFADRLDNAVLHLRVPSTVRRSSC